MGPINPNVYGASYGPWGIVKPDLMPLAIDSGLTFLRFPGGEWGDQNDYRDYHLDQFISFARQLNAEPNIHVRMPDSTAEKAAGVVRYCNIENDYKVRYWTIGNEPNLYTAWPMYEDFDTAKYNRVWREFAQAMRAVDPNIILLGPEIQAYNGDPKVGPKDEAGRDWMHEVLLANGDLVDIVSFHRYPFPTNKTGPTQTIDELRLNTREWDEIIPKLRAEIRATTGRDIPVAVTEINSDWTHATGGDSTPDSHYNAIWWGDVLGRLIKQKVDIVAYFLLTTQTSQGGYGLLARFEPRPTYFVYQIYQQFGDQLVYSSSDDPDVTIYAAERSDDNLTLIIINLGPEEKRKPILFENVTPSGPATVWLLDPEHNAEQIGAQTISNGTELALPAQSITLFIIPQ